tara:strand:- start:992 stop:3070 length:2079 start_codon:yes stop_codon:yes gene_type:complete
MIWSSGEARPMRGQEAGDWNQRIALAVQTRAQYEPQWQRAMDRYAKALVVEDQYEVNALMDFRHVESKKANLFYQTPEVQLIPLEPSIEGLPLTSLLPLRQKVLNYKMSADGTNVKREMHMALFDALAPSGFLITKIGYESATIKVTTPQANPADPLAPPEMVEVDVPIWEQCFWSRVSPMKVLIPHDFRNTNFDAAPWLGITGIMPITQAKRIWDIPDDFTGTVYDDEHVFAKDVNSVYGGSADPRVEYHEVWYRASLFDQSVVNPELFRCLVMVKGIEMPVKHIDSPYQAVDEYGRLTDDSMIGNPIHIGTLRDLADSAYVPSDLVVGEQLSREVNKFRTQQTRRRRANLPLMLLDTTNLDENTISKIERNEGPIPVPPGTLAQGPGAVMSVIPTGQEPRDNYTAQDYVERDWEKALGTSANQAGGFARGRRTATEARIVQGNSDTRNEAEKDRLREYFVTGVRKFDAVLQRYMGQKDLVKILGQQSAQLWEQWRNLPGRYVYRVQPDSGVHVDAVQFRTQKLDEYNLLRKDPQIDATVLLTGVVRALGYDPTKMVVKPTERGPESARVTLSLSGEDLVGIQSLAASEILKQAGYTLSEEAIAPLTQGGPPVAPMPGMPGVSPGVAGEDGAAPVVPLGMSDGMAALMPPGAPAVPGMMGPAAGHGGGATPPERVNQHATENTGALQGVGQ